MSNPAHDAIRAPNLCLAAAGLGVGGTSTGVSTTTSVTVINEGKFNTLGITATAALTGASGCALQAELTTCLYTISVDADDNFYVTKGREVLTADITDPAENDALEYPAPYKDTAAIGAVQVATAEGYTFQVGSTGFDATGITDIYLDLAGVPLTTEKVPLT